MSESLFISDVAGIQISKDINVAGLAILIYDYAITLEDESRWIWGRPWDATRVIFTISRYLPFAGAAFTAYAALRSPYGPCPKNLSVEENILHILGIIAAELLLVLRTYAFWGCNKRLLYGLVAYGLCMVAGAVIMNLFPPHTLLYNGPAPGIKDECQLASDSRNPALVYTFLLAFELVVFILTVYRRFHDDWSRTFRTSLLTTVYRDGVFYMICIMLITIANIVADAAFPIQFSDMLDIPQITLHSVLASRIMFNIRKSVNTVQDGETSQSTFAVRPFSTSVSAMQYLVPLESQASDDTSVGCSDDESEMELEVGRIGTGTGTGLSKAEESV